MTIECYYKHCKYHSIHTDPEDGPFCYELECRASEEDRECFEYLRQYELRNIHEGEKNDE